MSNLTRAGVTAASRIMLPAYVFLATYLGLVYLLDPQHRLHRSPSLALALLLLPMWLWGLMFLGIAGLMAYAMLVSRSRRGFAFALYVYMLGAVAWSAIYAGALFISPDASFASPAYPLFVATACYASARSILKGEV